jgi:hypothetical protein
VRCYWKPERSNVVVKETGIYSELPLRLDVTH